MSLSCECDFDVDLYGYAWFWTESSKPKPMKWRARRAKCASCWGMINTGDECVEYYRYKKADEDSIAYRIVGEDIPLASYFECEECNDLREALEELGYCVDLGDYMKDLVAEHNEIRQGRG